MKKCLLSTAFLLAFVHPVFAEAKTRHEALTDIASDIRRWLEGRSSEIAFGKIEGDKQPEANAGPGLCIELGRLLAAQKIAVTSSARYELRGHYQMVKIRGENLLVVDVEFWIVDQRSSKKVQTIRRRSIPAGQEMASLMGLTYALPENASDAEVTTVINESRDDARPSLIEGTKVLAQAKGKCAMELLVKRGPKFEAVKPRWEKGNAYVSLKKDDNYAIRLSNDTGKELAATVTIDSLNLFTFSTLQDKNNGLYPRLLVGTKAPATIEGWPITIKESRRFLITSYPETAAFKKQVMPEQLGVLTVSFAPAYEELPKGAKSAPGPFGTGMGQPINTPFEFKPRKFGEATDHISIRYVVEK